MIRNKAAVYLIAFSLFGLLGMQAMWLYNAIRQEQKFIADNSREAVKEVLQEIEQREDTRILKSNIDTLIKINHPRRPVVVKRENTTKVFLSDKRGRILIRESSFAKDTSVKAEIRIISDEVRVADGEMRETKKVKDYEFLFKKIIHQSRPENLRIEERINFKDAVSAVSDKLKTKGIFLQPELAIEKDSSVIFKTNAFEGKTLVSLPMFTKDIIKQGYRFSLSFPSTIGFILKKSTLLIVLSAFVTLLLITVMLMLYRKMLSEQKLNQYKNDFINNLTHELKTPLATISLANANISKSADYSNQEHIKQYTEIISEESNKLNNQIEKVFELSLLGKKKDILDLRRYELNELLSDCLRQNSLLLGTSALLVKQNDSQLYVNVDRFHFCNALTNILENAVKYSQGVPDISVSCEKSDDMCVIKITDKGIGIAKEHQKLIFDKFFRVTIKDLHDVKGFGIGLSYVKQVIELFGGRIYVESELNKGSEFIIELPDAKI